MWLIISLVAFLLFLWYIVMSVKSYSIKPERVTFFSGTMGSGKTLMATKKAVQYRAKAHLSCIVKKLRHPIIYHIEAPLIYSNIPLNSKYYRPLEVGHLTKDIPLPENSVVLIDEFGGVLANQYSFVSNIITERLCNFTRFSRHWFNGWLIITDQTADSIPKPVRDRLSCEYHLSHCRRCIPFFWMAKIDIIPVTHVTSDCENVVDVTKLKQVPYLFTKFPRRLYDSRCYRPTYYNGFVFNREDDICLEKLQTRYFMDIEPTNEENEAYKKNKKQIVRAELQKKLTSKKEQMF